MTISSEDFYFDEDVARLDDILSYGISLIVKKKKKAFFFFFKHKKNKEIKKTQSKSNKKISRRPFIISKIILRQIHYKPSYRKKIPHPKILQVYILLQYDYILTLPVHFMAIFFHNKKFLKRMLVFWRYLRYSILYIFLYLGFYRNNYVKRC